MEYPKIETLYNRDPNTRKVIPGDLRMPEFGSVRRWHLTEKVDGTNVRVFWDPNTNIVRIAGRTANSQMPITLYEHLGRTFLPHHFADAQLPKLILFGEGYGEKIQNGGGYRSGVSFRLFDVRIGDLWLEQDSLGDIASLLGIECVPQLGMIEALPKSAWDLKIAFGAMPLTANLDGGSGIQPEGIVARTYPLMLTRRGERIMWKLKFRDF